MKVQILSNEVSRLDHKRGCRWNRLFHQALLTFIEDLGFIGVISLKRWCRHFSHKFPVRDAGECQEEDERCCIWNWEGSCNSNMHEVFLHTVGRPPNGVRFIGLSLRTSLPGSSCWWRWCVGPLWSSSREGVALVRAARPTPSLGGGGARLSQMAVPGCPFPPTTFLNKFRSLRAKA